jgi:phosphocarrier protein
MSSSAHNISHEEIVELQKKFSETKHAIFSALAVMMAISEISQRRPDYSKKLANVVLTKAPQIVSSLQEFTKALNEKASPIVELQEKFWEIKHTINIFLAAMMALAEMSQRRPEFSEKLANMVLTKAPLIVSTLGEFTKALNEKAGPKPEIVELQEKFSEIKPIEKEFEIKWRLGLRTAALIVRLTRRFRSEISLSVGEDTVNAKSMMGVMMLDLSLKAGSRIRVTARGPDAAAAMDALSELFSCGARIDLCIEPGCPSPPILTGYTPDIIGYAGSIGHAWTVSRSDGSKVQPDA